MKQEIQRTFQHIPTSIRGHFILNLYAAIYYLFQYIHWLENVGGNSLNAMFKRYPFLSQYQEQMLVYMPQGLTSEEGNLWWQEKILQWEKDCNIHLPLKSLTDQGKFSFNKRIALMLCGLIEEDSRFGTLVSELHAPLQHRYFSLELLSSILSCQSQTSINDRLDASKECQSLIKQGFVDCLNKDAARSEWLLHVPVVIWESLCCGVAEQPLDGWRYHKFHDSAQLDQLIYPDKFLQRLHRLPSMVCSGQIKTLIFRADAGSDPVEIFAAIGKKFQQGLLVLSPESMIKKETLSLLAPLCVMSNSLPVLTYELAPSETSSIPELNGWTGVVGISMGTEGGLTGESLKGSIALTLPALNQQLRKRHWQKALGKENPNLDLIASGFHVSGKYIKQMTGIATSLAEFDGVKEVASSHVREASHTLNRQILESLADHLEPTGSWHNLVCNQTTETKLHELQQRCLYRESLLDNLGPAFKNNANRGIRALFTGVSGTGKTLAARILAAETKMDLYRVDLAAVINKYIGETEKNLHKILSLAESLDIILLLDEGDSILNARTDVKSSNDRYANMETNYLLQRLENYQGILIVTTNLSENIDRAFQRRMDVVIPFYSPQADERGLIMQLHLSDQHQVSSSYLQQIARKCNLTGGQIRNAANNAALNALQQKQVVNDAHIEKALTAEYQKAGGIYPLQPRNDAQPSDTDEMDNFILALHKLQG